MAIMYYYAMVLIYLPEQEESFLQVIAITLSRCFVCIKQSPDVDRVRNLLVCVWGV